MYEPTDRRKMLKVKLKSLAEEAKIIRLEEQRSKGWLRNELHNHRVTVVRQEARATQLAYAFIRGKKYRKVEPEGCKQSEYIQNAVWKRVETMVLRYGPFDKYPYEYLSKEKEATLKEKLKAWRSE